MTFCRTLQAAIPSQRTRRVISRRTFRPSGWWRACARRTRTGLVRRSSLLLVAAFLIPFVPGPADAQENCGNVLVFTIPGVTWQDIERQRPLELIDAIEDGAAAAIAVRTNEPNTDYASGFLTIGTGSRANADATAGGPAGFDDPEDPSSERVQVG